MPIRFFRRQQSSNTPAGSNEQERAPLTKRPSPQLDDVKLLKPRSIRSKITVSLLGLYILGAMAATAALISISRVESKIEIIE